MEICALCIARPRWRVVVYDEESGLRHEHPDVPEPQRTEILRVVRANGHYEIVN